MSEQPGQTGAQDQQPSASTSPATDPSMATAVTDASTAPTDSGAATDASASPAPTETSTAAEGASAVKSAGVEPAMSKARSDKGSPAKPSERAGSSRRSPSASRRRIRLGELDLAKAKIGFIGAGKMTESIVNGLIHYAKVQPSRICVAAPSSKNLERFKGLGCKVTKRNYDIFAHYDCDIVFLCFHGYVIKHCYKLGGTRPAPLTTNYIPHQRHPVYILSMVSGVGLSQIRACLLNPDSTSYSIEMHRIMMNTAVGHGLGMCAVDCEPDSKKLSAPLRQLLSSIAQLEHVPASQMDAACAVGGAGLAFSYYFIKALADGAFKMGLPRPQANRFAAKTAQCAAQTLLESGKSPVELRDAVSAPSGAAIYGIHVLEKYEVASGVATAVETAHKRANDLANQDLAHH